MNKKIGDIKFLVGNYNFKIKTKKPYEEIVCKFVANLSKELIKHKESSNYPDIKTLGFWCRKQNINNLKEKFGDGSIRFGLGLVFHITPSNIPTNFVYSLLFGLLTGNSNIVKVPSKKFYQVDIICSVIKKILKQKVFFPLKGMITILRYNNDDNFTKKISSICDARLIWGGNKSIESIRKFNLKERAIDIAFSDRFSLSVINSDKILKLKSYEFDRLIERFYNDTYLVDQNACSSPHLIIWLNNKKKIASNIFWTKLSSFLEYKYELPQIGSIDKKTKLFEDILNLKNIKNYKTFKNLIYLISLKKLDNNTCKLRGKWGYFYEFNADNLNSISKFIDKSCQTLTYFGMDKDYFKKFLLNKNIRGVDRIVPIGQALDINFNWDGYDLNKILTRVIDLK